MKKEKKTIVYYSKEDGEHKSCPIGSKKAKELHSCPYSEDIHGDYESLCDCGENATRDCAADI